MHLIRQNFNVPPPVDVTAEIVREWNKTAMNCVTACDPEGGRMPLSYSSDREAIAAALMTIRPYTQENLKIVHIKNTSELGQMVVSRGCLANLEDKRHVSIDRENIRFEFDSSGNLIS